MDAVALTARQRADLLLLIGAREIQASDVGARIDQPIAELNLILSIADLFPNRLVRVEHIARLIYISQLNRRACFERAAIGLLLTSDQPEKRRFACAVRPDHADDAAGREVEGQAFKQQPVAVSFAHAVGFDHYIAEARPRWNVNLQLIGVF